MPNYFTGKKSKYKWTIIVKNTIKNFLSPQEYYASKFQSQNPKF